MTDQFPPPHEGGQSQTTYADAKAQAKAAKAYAKAQRPWYKKKRWLLAIAVILVIVIIAASSGGSDPESDSLKSSTEDSTDTSADDEPASDDEGAKSEPSAPVGSQDNPAPRGTAVENKSARYRIDDVALRDSLGDFSDAPAGKYVVVKLTVTNVKDETIQISSGDFTLQVGGNEVDASDDAIFLDDAIVYDDLSPGLKRTGTIVFDVAPKDAGKGVVVAQAMLSADDPVFLRLK